MVMVFNSILRRKPEIFDYLLLICVKIGMIVRNIDFKIVYVDLGYSGTIRDSHM